MLLYRIIVKMWGFYSRFSHFFSWCDLLTSYMSTVSWIYLKSFFLPSICLHSTGTLRQHGLFGSNIVENSCGFWIKWLDKRESNKRRQNWNLKFLCIYNISITMLVLGGCRNTEAHTYKVKIKNTCKCWDFLVPLPLSGRALIQNGNSTATQTLIILIWSFTTILGPVWRLHSAPHCTGLPHWPGPIVMTDVVTLRWIERWYSWMMSWGF